MQTFWMVYVEEQRQPVFQHGSYLSAKYEAERLARLPELKGKKVYILQATDCCVCPPEIQWEEIEDSPF